MIDDEGSLFPIPSKGVQASSADDIGLQIVTDWFHDQKEMQSRMGAALRQSFDEVLDGQRTGRFDIDLLEKTEKTYLGTKVEILIRSEFGLERGGQKEMDYRIEGHQVDSKFSINGSWSIPSEAEGHLCLLTTANDRLGLFSAGIVRIKPSSLNQGRNKDNKTTLNKTGRADIRWLAFNAPLPRNLLLQLDPGTVEEIMRPSSGQQRINELIKRVQGTIIDRTTAITVARQADGMKRCRDARNQLRAKGIVLVGHQRQGPVVAGQLGLPKIEKGTFIAVRLIEVPGPTVERPAALLEGRYYAVASADDPEQHAPWIES
ncbi:NaeI family type II restriction endonuclease [Nocardia sp. NPDC055321]